MSIEISDITREIYESGKRLEKGSKELFSLAKEMAESEALYRKQLALEIIKLRDAKMPISIISDIARGNISDLKLKRDTAEFKYKAAISSLNAIQNQMSGLQTILKYQSDI